LKGGANYTGFTNASFPTDPLIGFHAGATVAFKITSNFLIQEEFLFSTQGAKSKGDFFTSQTNQNINLYYMAVPILLKYRTNSGFYIEAGAQTGYKLKEDVAGSGTGDLFKKLDLAAAGGIGYQTKIGLGIGARYVYGLSKVGDFKASDITNDFKNNAVQVSVFYVF